MKILVNRGCNGLRLEQAEYKLLIEKGMTVESSIYDVVTGSYNSISHNVDIVRNTNIDITNYTGDIPFYYYLNPKKYKEHDSSVNFRTNPIVIDYMISLNNPDYEVIEIPDGVEVYIEQDSESGAMEEIHEVHRVW